MENAQHPRRDAERLCGYGEAGESLGEGEAGSAVRPSEDGAFNMVNADTMRKLQ